MSVVEAAPPRIAYAPEHHSSAGQEAIELAALAGLVLDPWEAMVLDAALAEGPDGRWAAADVGLCVPRQNGKDAVLEARELAALFLLGEELTIHSAQHFKTAKEHFLRLVALVEGTPELERRVRRVIRASDDSFRVEWVERHYVDDALAATERWSAILTIVVQTPTDADRLKKNPLGVYVHSLNWSKELG